VQAVTRIHSERMTARVDGEVVVFLIGMRINRVWKIGLAKATAAVPAAGALESAAGRMRERAPVR